MENTAKSGQLARGVQKLTAYYILKISLTEWITTMATREYKGSKVERLKAYGKNTTVGPFEILAVGTRGSLSDAAEISVLTKSDFSGLSSETQIELNKVLAKIGAADLSETGKDGYFAKQFEASPVGALMCAGALVWGLVSAVAAISSNIILSDLLVVSAILVSLYLIVKN